MLATSSPPTLVIFTLNFSLTELPTFILSIVLDVSCSTVETVFFVKSAAGVPELLKNWIPFGKISLTCTRVAMPGPAFRTSKTYEIVSPTFGVVA